MVQRLAALVVGGSMPTSFGKGSLRERLAMDGSFPL